MKLRRKKRSGANQTQVEKWKELYKILFPQDEQIPPPFYEHSVAVPKGSYESGGKGFEDFVRSELPNRVKREVEQIEPQVAEPVKMRFVDIVRRALSELSGEYRPEISTVSSNDSQIGAAHGKEIAYEENLMETTLLGANLDNLNFEPYDFEQCMNGDMEFLYNGPVELQEADVASPEGFALVQSVTEEGGIFCEERDFVSGVDLSSILEG
ncbi:hypothetical protein DL767_001984 [Monosporascus sp. MG133]|nr:hypothetical protein DL767_001984 [Monosporascus sp. MG133]